MAILLRGKTTCPICGKVIEEGDEAISFPHFILNEKTHSSLCQTQHVIPLGVNADTLGVAMLAAVDEYYKPHRTWKTRLRRMWQSSPQSR